MATVVRPIEASDTAKVESVLASAFRDDPLIRCIAPAASRRGRVARWMQSAVVRYCARYGRADMTEASGETGETGGAGGAGGVAGWLPPDSTSVTPLGAFRTGMWRTPFTLGVRATWRLTVYARRKQRLRRSVLAGPYWYLMLIAVDPSRQSEGVGGALMRAGLDAVDADGQQCYLETTNEQNLSFFERYGFATMRHVEPTPTQPPLWAMIREARG